MDKKYKLKYLKYKKKYLELKGGVNIFFEAAFTTLINYCKKFNKINTKNLIAHVKGGSSIKYHLMNISMNTHEITDDLDILLVKCNDITDNEALTGFIDGLQKEITSYKITYEGNIDNINKYFRICLGGSCIIDLTIYKQDEYNDDETNMFSYAAKNIGCKNTHDYVSKLVEYYKLNLKNLTEEVIQNVTFTELKFEYYSSMKGLELQNKYIDICESGIWIKQLAVLRSLNDHSNDNMIARLEKQISPEYLAHLKNKRLRYIKKIDTIGKILAK